MSGIRKLIILISLLATLVAAAAAQMTFATAPAHEQHAGCHQPQPKSPASPNYSCCQAGHDSLLLLNSELTRFVAHSELFTMSAEPDLLVHFASATAASSSPPIGFPAPLTLRV